MDLSLIETTTSMNNKCKMAIFETFYCNILNILFKKKLILPNPEIKIKKKQQFLALSREKQQSNSKEITGLSDLIAFFMLHNV